MEEVEDLATLARLFDVKVDEILRVWGALGIDRRGLSSAKRWRGGVVEGVGSFVTAPGSRKRFDEAVQKRGDSWTVEYWILTDRFRPLFDAPVLRHAQLRIDRRPEP